mmetsp:Transcript_70787/g.169471  ORF Transcript_70787/g.169471 Transcript_70787/m.169471 type:complete len:277 (-) Transcript_70787:849-1679(-)
MGTLLQDCLSQPLLWNAPYRHVNDASASPAGTCNPAAQSKGQVPFTRSGLLGVIRAQSSSGSTKGGGLAHSLSKHVGKGSCQTLLNGPCGRHWKAPLARKPAEHDIFTTGPSASNVVFASKPMKPRNSAGGSSMSGDPHNGQGHGMLTSCTSSPPTAAPPLVPEVHKAPSNEGARQMRVLVAQCPKLGGLPVQVDSEQETSSKSFTKAAQYEDTGVLRDHTCVLSVIDTPAWSRLPAAISMEALPAAMPSTPVSEAFNDSSDKACNCRSGAVKDAK